MTEHMVQVPVSLLRRWVDEFDHRIPEQFADELHDLFSQPTPTADRIEDVMQRNWDRRYGAAEPPRDARSAMERESDALDELRNTPVPTTEPDGDESGWPEPHDLPPETPRIEDMAPEHSYEAMRTDIISALAADGFSYLESEQLLRRFESTIRNVTSPQEDNTSNT